MMEDEMHTDVVAGQKAFVRLIGLATSAAAANNRLVQVLVQRHDYDLDKPSQEPSLESYRLQTRVLAGGAQRGMQWARARLSLGQLAPILPHQQMDPLFALGEEVEHEMSVLGDVPADDED